MKNVILSLISLFFFQFCQAGIPYRWKSINKDFDRLASLCEEFNFNDQDRKELEPIVETMGQIAHRLGDRQLQARALYWKAWQQENVPIDSSLRWLNQALALCDSTRYKHDNLRMQLFKAGLLRVKGQYLESYRLGKAVAEAGEAENDWFYVGKAEVQLGAVMGDLGEHALALHHYREAGEHFTHAESKESETKNRLNIANALYWTGKKGEAQNTLDSLLKDPIAKGDTSFYVNVLVSLTSMSANPSIEWAKEAWNLSQKEGSPQLICLAAQTMGMHMLVQGRIDSALIYYRKAVDNSKTCPKGMQLPAYNGLAAAFAQLGMRDSSELYEAMMKGIEANIQSQNVVSELEKQDIVKKINSLEEESLKAKESAARMRMATGAIVAASVLALLIAFYFIRKAYKKKRAKEKEALTLMQKNNKMRMDLEDKDRALEKSNIAESEHQQHLKDLQEEIKLLRKSQRLHNAEEPENAKKGSESMASKQWERLRIRFEDTNPQLLSHLKEQCPALSEKELWLCAYIHAGLTSKEIASMNGVLPETINTARYRLRKKLDLPRHLSLEDFLRNIL